MSRDSIVEEAAALLRSGCNQEAISFLRSQKTLSARALHYLCDAYFQSRDWSHAYEIVQLLISTGHATPYNIKLEAKILSNWGRHREALERMTTFLEKYESDVEALGIAKICSHFSGDSSDALRYGQKALLLKDQLAGPNATDLRDMIPNKVGQKFISFSVWGTHKAYLLGAAINVKRAAEHFRDWRVRIYAEVSLGPAVSRSIPSPGCRGASC